MYESHPKSFISSSGFAGIIFYVWQTWCDSMFPHGVHSHAIIRCRCFKIACAWMPRLYMENVHLAMMGLCVAGVCQCRAAFTRCIVLSPHYHAFVLLHYFQDVACKPSFRNKVATLCWVSLPLVPTQPCAILAGTCSSVSS